MDFDRPTTTTRGLPAKEALGPGDNDADSGAGNWWVWDNIIDDQGGGITKTAPNPMSPSQPDPMPSLLASQLHWGTPQRRK